MKNSFRAFAVLVCLATVAIPLQAGKKTTIVDTPSISCAPGSTPASIKVTVTGGANTGLPAGFSVQWMLESEFLANGGVWPVDSYVDQNVSSFCKASFSGNAYGYNYAISANGSMTVTLGDVIFDTPGASSACENVPLKCGKNYVFRAFGHATSTLMRSAWSNTTTCATAACATSGGCTYTQGYWKTHGPIPTGNNTNQWPVTSLTLGNVTYTDYELLAIFNNSGAGNGLVKLAHQLIAAKLNVANGAWDSSSSSIAAADAMIGNLVVPPVGTGSLSAGSTSALVTALTNYNEGATGPGHCN